MFHSETNCVTNNQIKQNGDAILKTLGSQKKFGPPPTVVSIPEPEWYIPKEGGCGNKQIEVGY